MTYGADDVLSLCMVAHRHVIYSTLCRPWGVVAYFELVVLHGEQRGMSSE